MAADVTANAPAESIAQALRQISTLVTLRWALPALALITSSCGGREETGICGYLSELKKVDGAPKNAQAPFGVAIGCVEHWSARLARGKEPADVVARAAVAACDGAVDLYVHMATREAAKEMFDPPAEARLEYWTRRALFIAVQTRAGNCYPDV